MKYSPTLSHIFLRSLNGFYIYLYNFCCFYAVAIYRRPSRGRDAGTKQEKDELAAANGNDDDGGEKRAQIKQTQFFFFFFFFNIFITTELSRSLVFSLRSLFYSVKLEEKSRRRRYFNTLLYCNENRKKYIYMSETHFLFLFGHIDIIL